MITVPSQKFCENAQFAWQLQLSLDSGTSIEDSITALSVSLSPEQRAISLNMAPASPTQFLSEDLAPYP
jgi:hypothetical protein